MQTHSRCTHSPHPHLAAVSQGKDTWQPNHTNCKQNNLSSKSTPSPTVLCPGTPRGARTGYSSSSPEFTSSHPAKNQCKAWLHTPAQLRGKNHSQPSEQNYSVKDKQISFKDNKTTGNKDFVTFSIS